MPQQLDHRFTATISTPEGGPDWVVIDMPGSIEFFGTGRAVKIVGTVDGHPVQTAFMPTGNGGHFLPVSAKLRRAIGKGLGDDVTVHLQQRLS